MGSQKSCRKGDGPGEEIGREKGGRARGGADRDGEKGEHPERCSGVHQICSVKSESIYFFMGPQ